jgi:predicted transposase YbfD/YdcC
MKGRSTSCSTCRTDADRPLAFLKVAVVISSDGVNEDPPSRVVHDVAWLAEQHGFPGLRAVGKVHGMREIDGQTTTASRCYILSEPLAADRFLEVVRAHWHVENRLHWVLDVVMDEDQARAERTTRRKTSPDCDASPSTSSAPTTTKAPPAARSSEPLGTTSFLLKLLATA